MVTDIIAMLVFGAAFAWFMLDNHFANKAIRSVCKQLVQVNQAMLDQLESQDREFQHALKSIKEKIND